MRDHAIVSPQFWTGETGRALRRDPDAQRIALYLMTCPNANMIGLYYLPIPLICHEVGIDEEGAIKGLARLSQVHFSAYDPPSETVFVFNMARYQIGESLDHKDNRYKGVLRMLGQVKNSPFYNDFLALYGEVYGLDLQPITRPSQDPPKPLHSPLVGGLFIDQDQEQDKEQGQDQEQCGGAKAARAQDLEDRRDVKVVEPVNAPAFPCVTTDAIDRFEAQFLPHPFPLRQQAREVLGYFNQVLGAQFENTREIETLMAEHEVSVADCRLVIDWLCAIDRPQNPENHAKYVDSVIPFRWANFDRHRGRARNWEAEGRPAYMETHAHGNGSVSAKGLRNMAITRQLLKEDGLL